MSALAKPAIRPLEPDIYTYKSRGWIEIKQLLSRDEALKLQQLALKLAAEKDMAPAEPDKQPEGQQFVGDKNHMRKKLILHDEPVAHEPIFWQVASSPRILGFVKRYLQCDAVKYMRSEIFEKGTVAEGLGEETELHQDMPYMPMDRTGGLTVWIALCDIPPEMGTLHFVDGSHRYGPLGRDSIPGFKPDRIQTMREQEGWELVGPGVMQAGDATFHDDLLVHGAPRNLSDRHRFAFGITYMRDDVLYTGAPWRNTDGLGLKPMQRFDHPRFPTL